MAELTWLLATGNRGKLRELHAILAPYGVDLVGLDDMQIAADSPETADSFLGNAIQKAQYYYRQAKCPVLADDSGLEVDALNGLPGIHSARFGGFETHAKKRRYLLDLLHGVESDYRSARFCCAAVYYDGRQIHQAQATVEGFITLEERGSGGFGYDPIFQCEWGGPTMAEIDAAEKHRLSHRGKAFRLLMERILEP